MKHVLRGLIVFFLLFAATTSAYAYGESASFAGSTTMPPTCSNPAPAMVWPFSARAIGAGTVELTWGEVPNVSSWTVAYGTAPGTYIYGISQFGNSLSRSIQIGSLPSGVYYFAMRANNGCKPGPFSNEWRVVVGGGGGGRALLTSLGGGTGGTPGRIIATPTPTTRVQATPTPRPGAPTGTTAPSGGQSWWQQLLNFIFGKK